jgi:pyridoxine 5-phosphate synthase
MALAAEIIDIALEVKPDSVTLVPEKRRELTTEGGLDVSGNMDAVSRAVERFHQRDIVVSLFIDPDPAQVDAAARAGADFVEIHTGRYSDAGSVAARAAELELIGEACITARNLGLGLNAGHGLNYHNVVPVAAIAGMQELNIGHSIIGRAVLVGLERAVREMKALIAEACRP